jgi:hypothetical protein
MVLDGMLVGSSPAKAATDSSCSLIINDERDVDQCEYHGNYVN